MPRRCSDIGRRTRRANRERQRRSNHTDQESKMPRKKSDLNNACSKDSRRKRAERTRQLNSVIQLQEAKRLAANQMPDQGPKITGYYSQDMNSTDSIQRRNKEMLHLTEEKQKKFNFSKNVTNLDTPVIKTEILDPFEQNQELIIPDYPECVNTLDPMNVVETQILDSSETNPILLSNIKIEHDESVDEFSRTEKLSESNANREIDVISKYKLTNCFVLLHDCLVPENFAAISSKFKSIKINRDMSETFPHVHLFTLSDSPFFGHISESYIKLAFSKGCTKMSLNGPDKDAISSKKGQGSIPFSRIRPNMVRKKKTRPKKSKPICNCFTAHEDEIVSMRSKVHENKFEPTQQLCSCLTEDFTMKPVELDMKEISLFDPDFGKVSRGLNKIDYNF